MQENIAKTEPQKAVSTSTNFQLNNSTLSRLMNEVKNEKLTINGSYDRTHNRHNRGK